MCVAPNDIFSVRICHTNLQFILRILILHRDKHIHVCHLWWFFQPSSSHKSTAYPPEDPYGGLYSAPGHVPFPPPFPTPSRMDSCEFALDDISIRNHTNDDKSAAYPYDVPKRMDSCVLLVMIYSLSVIVTQICSLSSDWSISCTETNGFMYVSPNNIISDRHHHKSAALPAYPPINPYPAPSRIDSCVLPLWYFLSVIVTNLQLIFRICHRRSMETHLGRKSL